MRLPDDDEIYDVDQTYLGPPGYYIGRLRYRMIAVTPVMVLFGLAFLLKTGIGFTLLSVALTVLVALRLSQWIVDRTTHERPIGVLVATFWHELTAPRLPMRGQQARQPAAFRRRATSVGADHPLTTGRRRWRSYANRQATARGAEREGE
ncbi:hypothetical protein [Isoptericola sp. NPDC057559]|uniref:hypothetical protein n=1 Tax=Isoptericola sp. NPDC057559 TaxID=3346168 RepID=UPI00369248AB